MFYNKEIQIYIYGDKKDDHGITRTGYSPLATDEPIMVDMQPYSTEKAKKDYGYDIECTRKMFCDIIPQITEDCRIKYNEKFYKITAIPWDDDYLEALLNETKDVEVIENEVISNG
ncbi:hypothetical protein B0P06_005272 [Clostridium saccharoperbutylacetonicum]|uniref:Phage head-tail adaptor n=1 Tax=Clostridium saccharoperbutylacetonicum N1-4(HMT) TaxID=931276 RepID=M1MEW6_9CLOT|nr:hypothetical protein [Clostridium saccharoperbutylacetonicum]AGF56459.1 hypothetical protein Cspa_c26940 [Clostridium saccharoperbutylacetonicum N1-4(HMT)]NRT62794.1 hypothetical protein [Clostridium saccharoperbutylacetonicum]NSB26148.1 hypothetical protein [Clostridium saccharoperbutylacetonicum]NSB45501.1 hypothetical protein [Clostridium saccharoperbutylacetonicum]